MAIEYFTGTGAVSPADVATGAYWSTAAVPSAGSDVLIASTGLALYGTIAGNDVNTVKVTRGWTGAYLGNSANAFIVQCNGSGTYVDIDLGPQVTDCRLETATTALTRLFLRSCGGSIPNITSGTWTEILGGSVGGRAIIGASAVVTGINTGSIRFEAMAGTVFTTAHIDQGGELKTLRGITTAFNKGKLIMRNTAVGATVYNAPGSIFNPRGSTAATTHTTVYLDNAMLSLEEAVGDVTITNLYYNKGSKIQWENSGVKLIVTNEVAY